MLEIFLLGIHITTIQSSATSKAKQTNAKNHASSNKIKIT